MPAPLAVLRVAKVKTLQQIAAMSRHHERSRPTPNADPAGEVRTLVGCGLPEAEASALLATLPRPPRKGAVLAIEVVITASPSYFRPHDPSAHGEHDPARTEAWAMASMDWLRQHFGADNIASATLHGDESTPHIHGVIIPIDRTPSTRRQQPRLNAARWLDGADRLSAMQDSYAAAVSGLGIERGQKGSKATHQEVRHWYSIAGHAATRAVAARDQAETMLIGLRAVAEGRVHVREEVSNGGRRRKRIAVDGMAPDDLARIIKAPIGAVIWQIAHDIAEAAAAEAGRARAAAIATIEDQVREARDWCRTVMARSQELDVALAARERAAVLGLAGMLAHQPEPRQKAQRVR